MFKEEGADFLRYVDLILSIFAIILLIYPLVGFSLPVQSYLLFLAPWAGFITFNLILSYLYKQRLLIPYSEGLRVTGNIILISISYGQLSNYGIDYWYMFMLVASGNISMLVIVFRINRFISLIIIPGTYILAAMLFYQPSWEIYEIAFHGCILGFVTLSTHTITSWMTSKYTELRKLNQEMQELSETLDEKVQSRTIALEQMSKYKTEFLASMSHEIRTPLNSILGVGELFLAGLKGENLKLAQLMQKSGSQLNYLINDILDYARIESGEIQIEKIPFNLHERLTHIESIFAPLCMEKGLSFKLHLDSDVPIFVIGDPYRFFQMISNLVNNSLKFTESGGVFIDVRCGKETDQAVEIAFIVRDTGIGIPEGENKLIFGSFHQSHKISNKKGGVGLGLAIVDSLTKQMGGGIYFTSIVNKGTSFRITLPFQITDEAVDEPSILIDEPEDITGTILVAEDMEDNRILLSAFLKSVNVRIDFAGDGKEALEKRKRNQYDLILMDIQMPFMDGYESIRLIRKWEFDSASPAIPIVGLSAYADKQAIKKCISLGASDYLTKPLKKSLLLKALVTYLPSK